MPHTDFKPLSDEELDRLPTGVCSFKEIRQGRNIYVDKTELIHSLALTHKRYFLSRPRRFGKTLLINTLEALFRDGLEDFRGLAIEKLWHDTTYDVLHLDFAGISDFKSADEFKTELYKKINFFMLKHPVSDDIALSSDCDPWSRFDTYLSLRPTGQMVVLIDEYDAPLTHCLKDQDLFKDVSGILSQFYQILKSQSGALRFMLVTGICRFQHLGIFSGSNHLIDISMNPKYGTITGYDVSELTQYFSAYIDNAAGILGISRDECLEKLKYHYDGFCFDEQAKTHVFSPWSVLNFMQSPELGFSNYWYATAGDSTVLMEYLKQHGIKSPESYAQDVLISKETLQSTLSLNKLDDRAMLFHTGYLSIKGIDEYFGDLILNYPNHEVADSLAKTYAEHELNKNELRAFTDLLLKGDPEQLIAELNRFLTSLDYRDYKLQDEASVRSMLQLTLMISGLHPKVEVHNHKGRSDLEVLADRRYFVFELKYQREGERSAEALLEEASAQIVANHYGEQNFPELPHIRIALVFSQQERRFSLWKVF